jgi:hypothetical protein
VPEVDVVVAMTTQQQPVHLLTERKKGGVEKEKEKEKEEEDGGYCWQSYVSSKSDRLADEAWGGG